MQAPTYLTNAMPAADALAGVATQQASMCTHGHYTNDNVLLPPERSSGNQIFAPTAWATALTSPWPCLTSTWQMATAAAQPSALEPGLATPSEEDGLH